jgi:ABC-type multidrug transport system ATPase subunit
LLIQDEPTSGLDPLASRSLNELIVEYQGRGATVLLSSHLLDQVERLCQRIAIVSGGRVAACGTLDELRRERARGGSLEDVFFAVMSANGSAGPADIAAAGAAESVRERG